MNLMHTSLLSGLSILAKIITGILILKIVAMDTGPTGVALLGQFSTLVGVLSVIAGGGIGVGVIKFVAKYRAHPSQLEPFLQSAATYTMFFSILSMVLGLLFASSLASWILGQTNYTILVRCLFVTQLAIAANLLIYAVLNGDGKIRLLVIANIFSSVFSLLLIGTMTHYYHLNGALFAILLSQIMTLLVSLICVYQETWFRFLRPIKAKITHLFDLSHYSLMNTVSAVTVPVAQILVRNDISTLMGWDTVGYWQAVLRISDAYLMLVTTIFTAYYLPRFSQLTDLKSIKKEIKDAHIKLLPIVAFTLFVLYICRHLMISLLYNSDFEAATPLFLYQLLGDFFRIAAWIITYLLLAKSWTKTYIATEVILSILFVFCSFVFVRWAGLMGVTYAFALTYFIYWVLMVGVAQVYFKQEKVRKSS